MSDDPHARLSREKVAIVGVGGTGSHILDFVVKTPVARISLYDNDEYDDRTPLRSPGPKAPGNAKHKVERHAQRYGDRRIHPHPVLIDKQNADQLGAYDTVFLCIGAGPVKRRIVEVCMRKSNGLLIDVGMAVRPVRTRRVLYGMIRITTLIPEKQGHAKRIGLDHPSSDPTSRNHQTIELNALNAAMAVIKWKKIRGVFEDSTGELHSLYNIASNRLSNRYTTSGRFWRV